MEPTSAFGPFRQEDTVISSTENEEQKDGKGIYAGMDQKQILLKMKSDIIEEEGSDSDSDEDFRETDTRGEAVFENLIIIDHERDEKSVQEWIKAANEYSFYNKNIGDKVIRRVRMTLDEDEDIMITYDSAKGGYGVLIRIHNINDVSPAENYALMKALELTRVGKRFVDSLFDEFIEESRKEAELEQVDIIYELAQITSVNMDGLSPYELNNIVESELQKWRAQGKFQLKHMKQIELQKLDSSFERKNLAGRLMPNYDQEQYDILANNRLKNHMSTSELEKLEKKCYLTTMSKPELAELTNRLNKLKLEKLVISEVKQLKTTESMKLKQITEFADYTGTLSMKYEDLVWNNREIKKLRQKIIDVDFTEHGGAEFKKMYGIDQLEENELEELKRRCGDLHTTEMKLEELKDFELAELTDADEAALKVEFHLKKLLFQEWKEGEKFRAVHRSLKKKHKLELLEKHLENAKCEIGYKKTSNKEDFTELKRKYELNELSTSEFGNLKRACEDEKRAEALVDAFQKKHGLGSKVNNYGLYVKEFEFKAAMMTKRKKDKEIKEFLKKYDYDDAGPWGESDIAELKDKILQEGLTKSEEHETRQYFYFENMKKSEFDQLRNICAEVRTADITIQRAQKAQITEPDLENLTKKQWEELKKERQIKKLAESMWETFHDLQTETGKAEDDAFFLASELMKRYGMEWEDEEVENMKRDFMAVGMTEQEMSDKKKKIEQAAAAETELENTMTAYSLGAATLNDIQELMASTTLKKLAKAWKAKFGLKELSHIDLKAVKEKIQAADDAEEQVKKSDMDEWRTTKSTKVHTMVELLELKKNQVNELKKEYGLESLPKAEFKKLKRTMGLWWKCENELNRLKEKFKLVELSESDKKDLEMDYEIERRRVGAAYLNETRLDGRRFAVISPSMCNETRPELVDYPTIVETRYNFRDNNDSNYIEFLIYLRDYDEDGNPLQYLTSVICTYHLPLSQYHLQGHDSEALATLLSVFKLNGMLSLMELWLFFEANHKLLRTVETNCYREPSGAKCIEISIFPTVPIPEEVPEDIQKLLRGEEAWDY